jgi:hypothetical protein
MEFFLWSETAERRRVEGGAKTARRALRCVFSERFVLGRSRISFDRRSSFLVLQSETPRNFGPRRSDAYVDSFDRITVIRDDPPVNRTKLRRRFRKMRRAMRADARLQPVAAPANYLADRFS